MDCNTVSVYGVILSKFFSDGLFNLAKILTYFSIVFEECENMWDSTSDPHNTVSSIWNSGNDSAICDNRIYIGEDANSANPLPFSSVVVPD